MKDEKDMILIEKNFFSCLPSKGHLKKWDYFVSAC